ncbi:hypothetical protein [Sorangium sp. So ce513]|uniref:hypothetical protein n=1 Tax=Sorangium sp. So ce513 TaxID=3133315 RepID=UPI003F63EDD4
MLAQQPVDGVMLDPPHEPGRIAASCRISPSRCSICRRLKPEMHHGAQCAWPPSITGHAQASMPAQKGRNRK